YLRFFRFSGFCFVVIAAAPQPRGSPPPGRVETNLAGLGTSSAFSKSPLVARRTRRISALPCHDLSSPQAGASGLPGVVRPRSLAPDFHGLLGKGANVEDARRPRLTLCPP